MKRRKQKDYRNHKPLSILIEYILPLISGILVIASISLQYGVRKYMGLQRDLVYRNKLLTNSILSSNRLNLYQLIVVIGLVFCLIMYFRQKNKHSKYSRRFSDSTWCNKLNRILTLISLTSIVWLSLTVYYPNSNTLAYPWIILTLLVAIIIQYIRLIHLYFRKS